MSLKYEDILGKILLIGITYYTHDDQYIDQKEFWGIVTTANEEEITIKQSNGAPFSIPPDLSSITQADEGEYTLNSTGEVVVNPDFLSTWSLYKPEQPNADI